MFEFVSNDLPKVVTNENIVICKIRWHPLVLKSVNFRWSAMFVIQRILTRAWSEMFSVEARTLAAKSENRYDGLDSYQRTFLNEVRREILLDNYLRWNTYTHKNSIRKKETLSNVHAKEKKHTIKIFKIEK